MNLSGTEVLVGVVLPYATVLVFVVGSAVRFVIWIRVPEPFPVTLSPARRTRLGVLAGLVGDLLLFPSLFRSDRVLWCGVWFLHGGLFVVVLGHLRYFTYPVPLWVGTAREGALWAGYLVTFVVIGILARKGFHERLAFLTGISDLVGPLLLLGACATGLLLAYLNHADLIEVKAFAMGLAALHPEPIPSSGLFRIHFALGCLLACYFPFGRLVHALGWVISPSIASRDKPDSG